MSYTNKIVTFSVTFLLGYIVGAGTLKPFIEISTQTPASHLSTRINDVNEKLSEIDKNLAETAKLRDEISRLQAHLRLSEEEVKKTVNQRFNSLEKEFDSAQL